MPSRVVLPFEDPATRLSNAIKTGLIRCLTCQEIAAQYPPERVELLLAATRLNAVTPSIVSAWDQEAVLASLAPIESEEEP